MKTISKLLCLALSASLLSGCKVISNIINGGGKSSSSNNSSDNGSSSGHSSSSSSQGGSSSSSSQGGGGGGGGGGSSQVTEWPQALKTLLNQYAGEVIPVPNNFGTAVDYDVEDDALWIDGTSSSFTIANYYEQLESAGWSSTLDGTSHVLIDDTSGDEYYECYKVSGMTTYYVQYFYSDYYTANEIWAWAETMSTDLTTDTAWSIEDQESMLATFGEVLPFQKFGSDYIWEFSGLVGYLSDSYYQDLSTSYNTLLGSNGFTLVTSGDYQGAYQKSVADGNTLYAYAEFTEGTGNAVFVELAPVMNAGWPTAALEEMIGSLGITVPQPSSGTFSWYKINGAITATTDTDSPIVNDYCNVLESWNLIVDSTSYYYYSYGLMDYVLAYPWEENVEIDFGDVYVSDDENVSVESFFVTVKLMTPSSGFSNSWPESEISEFLGEGAPEIPVAEKESIKDFKFYETEDSDGTEVFVIKAYDDNTPGVDSIEDTYLPKFGEGWTVDDSQYDDEGYIAIDTNNKVKVQFFSYVGFFSCFIYKLNGVAPIDVGETVTITPNDVPTKYDDSATERTICGLTMMVCNVMKQSGKIQLKKNSTNMYNTTAYAPMASITFTGTNKQDDTFTVYAGTSSSSLEVMTPIVSGTTITYNMGGATFFKIENGAGVFTCDSNVFGFAA